MRSERSRRFTLLVEASGSVVNEDSSDAQRLAYATVEIQVIEDKALEPQFLQQRYSASVSEAKNRGEFVIQVEFFVSLCSYLFNNHFCSRLPPVIEAPPKMLD